MFVVAVELAVDPARMDEFMPLMAQNARISRTTELGCQQFDVCREGAEVFLYEVYDNRAAFDAHLETPHFREFDAAAGPMITSKRLRMFNEVIR